MFRTIAAIVLFCPIALSQVRVSTPRTEFKSHDQINVQVTNGGKRTVSYCVEFGQYSFKTGGGGADDMESTPIPFYVQRQNGHKWGILLIGPDLGSSRHAVTLKPGESQQYPFRLSDRGRMRLVLEYWNGDNDKVCEHPKRKKTARSSVFVVN
jgi:hypothetical protein